MDARIVLALLVQSLILVPGVGPDELDAATQQHVREREEMLRHKMTRLLQELEQDSQSSSAREALPFAASQQWHIWAISAGLILHFGLCWWLWKRCSRNKVGMKKHEKKPGIALDVDRVPHTPFTLVPPELINSVHERMTDLLRQCLKRSRKDFFPVLYTPIIMRCKSEAHRPLFYHAVYRLLVPVKAPRGHSFHLERCFTGKVRSKGSRIRVELKCTCEKQQPDKDMLCFLHHPKEELRRNQAPSLLDTLCSSSYLDLEKTTRWFCKLVRSSWAALPQVKDCRLDVTIRSPFCRLKMYRSSNVCLVVEILFSVKEDDSDSRRSIDWQSPQQQDEARELCSGRGAVLQALGQP